MRFSCVSRFFTNKNFTLSSNIMIYKDGIFKKIRNRYEKNGNTNGESREMRGKLFFQFMILCFFIATFLYLEKKTIVMTSSQTEKKNENLPIYSVDTGEKKYISLTFDAAWGTEDLEQILDILDKNKVKASFFVTGDWVSCYPEAIKELAKRGHDIGNHGDNHKHMTQIGKEEQIEEIKGAHNKIKSLLGKEMNLFRAPYGDYNEEVVKTARECGYYTIQWDVDSLDWKNYGVDNIVQTVVEHKNLQNGSIVLLHNGTQYTKDALETIIVELKRKGYTFVPVSKMIYREGYKMDVTGRQVKG